MQSYTYSVACCGEEWTIPFNMVLQRMHIHIHYKKQHIHHARTNSEVLGAGGGGLRYNEFAEHAEIHQGYYIY